MSPSPPFNRKASPSTSPPPQRGPIYAGKGSSTTSQYLNDCNGAVDGYSGAMNKDGEIVVRKFSLVWKCLMCISVLLQTFRTLT